MTAIADWLASLELERYSPKFEEQQINLKVLPSLTDQDLKDLGVSLLGHRRALMMAIEQLGAPPRAVARTTPSEAGAHPAQVKNATPQKAPGGERRQITVLFCDLVGSTALSAQLDPEDLRVVVSAYHRGCADLVEANGGYVAQYLGDGILAYFGYPQAHEHDAERAVQAGLALASTAPNLATAPGISLAVRVGIATGTVVVGDLMRAGEGHERGVVGGTPNLAARLQGLAQPGRVVIAESTRRLVGDLFELADLGQHELKGISAQVQAWSVLRPRSVESRFEALHGVGLTALVGREEELDLLAHRWASVKAGEGHVVLVAGEPGIGKSRLIVELMERPAAEPHTRLRYFCSPQRTDSAFFPIIGQLERAAGFALDDTPAAKLDKLDSLLTQSAASPEDAGLIADMLSLPADGRYPAQELDPPTRRQRTLQALSAQVEALAGAAPVLMILEDAHWCDPTSLEAFGRTVDGIADLRALLVITYRPEFEPAWIGRPYVTALTLNRLGRADIVALIARVTGNKALPEATRADIVERTDGIPLFVEEMTKAVLEAESEDEARRTVAAAPSSAVAVPASLHASLMARLDRLGPAKEVAQVGAAIGREFSYALFAMVAERPQEELAAALDRLVGAGLLFRQGVGANASYLFKHALVQDAAYGTLLREPRRALHARIVEALEALVPDVAATRPEVLAHHCVEAGLIERGAKLWGTAGQQACVRSANTEAETMLRRALALIERLPSTSETRRDEITFQTALMNALCIMHGWAAAPTNEATERARLLMERAESLGDTLEDPLALYAILYGIWVRYRTDFDGAQILALGQEFVSLAERSNNVPAIAFGRLLLSVAQVETGASESAKPLLELTIAGLKLLDIQVFIKLSNLDFLSYAHVTSSFASYLLGYQDMCSNFADIAIDSAEEHGHIPSIVVNNWCCAPMRFLTGANEKLLRECAAAARMGEQANSAQFSVSENIPILLLNSTNGDPARTLQAYDSTWKIYRLSGLLCYTCFYLTFVAQAHMRLGDFVAARGCIREALDLVERKQDRWFEADVHRMAGEIARAAPERDEVEAEACFERALAVARAQKARSLELRAATSFARMRRDQGRATEARDLLAPVYAWFTEGFDKPDLKAAKALLDELG